MMYRAMTIWLTVLAMAACYPPPADDTSPMVYRVTADDTGWASAKVEGYTFGDMVDVTAYEVHTISNGGDPWYEQLDGVGFLLDGSVCVEVEPGVEVVFVVWLLDGRLDDGE